MSVAVGEVVGGGNSRSIPRNRGQDFANPRGKWSRFLYCLVETYASPCYFASNATLLTDKRFVSLLSREFPVVALKLLGYDFLADSWCQQSARLPVIKPRDHGFDPTVAKARHDRALILRRLSFDCVCNTEMVARKSSRQSYRPVDVSSEMRELVNAVLFSRERIPLNRQHRERDQTSPAEPETDVSDDDADLTCDMDLGELVSAQSHPCYGSRNKRERCRSSTTSWYLKVLSLRDSWEDVVPARNKMTGATSFDQKRWRRDAFGFINRVCADGPLSCDGASPLRTVV